MEDVWVYERELADLRIRDLRSLVAGVSDFLFATVQMTNSNRKDREEKV
jgi:hypothetical protein